MCRDEILLLTWLAHVRRVVHGRGVGLAVRWHPGSARRLHHALLGSCVSLLLVLHLHHVLLLGLLLSQLHLSLLLLHLLEGELTLVLQSKIQRITKIFCSQ